MRCLITLVAFITVLLAQMIYVDDFYLVQLKTPGITNEKLKSLVINLNKETFAKQTTRVANFIKNNVPKTDQESEKAAMMVELIKVDNIRKYMAPIWKQLKSSKALGDAKIKEVKTVFNKADYNMTHNMKKTWPLFYSKIKTVFPTDKWTKVDATISKARTTFEKNNKAVNDKLFPPPTRFTGK